MEPKPDSSRRRFLALAGAAATVPLVDAIGLPAVAARAGTGGRKPNILLLLTDEERQNVDRPAGFSLPVRDQLTAAGTRFTMHHTPTTPCSPARSVLFTGVHAPVNGIRDNVNGNKALSTSFPTMGAMLKAAGYRTAYVGKWHLSVVSGDDPAALQKWGFDEAYEILGGGPPDAGANDDASVAAQARAWLTARADDTRPWLLVVSMINPHDIMWCPTFYTLKTVPELGAGLPSNFETNLSSKPSVQESWRGACQLIGGLMPNDVSKAANAGAWRKYSNWYLHLLQETDALMGQVLTALKGSAQGSSTVVMHVADHGELGGAHGLRQKGSMIYQENLRVPLVIVDPRNAAARNRVSSAVTSHLDLVPTVAALTGAVAPPGHGKSLVPLMSGTATSVREGLLVTCDSLRAGLYDPSLKSFLRGVITPQYSYGRYSTPSTVHDPSASHQLEAYDREADPGELNNLAHSARSAALIASLDALTNQLIAAELH
jgi:arylsulfatase A-like enzyme